MLCDRARGTNRIEPIRLGRQDESAGRGAISHDSRSAARNLFDDVRQIGWRRVSEIGAGPPRILEGDDKFPVGVNQRPAQATAGVASGDDSPQGLELQGARRQLFERVGVNDTGRPKRPRRKPGNDRIAPHAEAARRCDHKEKHRVPKALFTL